MIGFLVGYTGGDVIARVVARGPRKTTVRIADAGPNSDEFSDIDEFAVDKGKTAALHAGRFTGKVSCGLPELLENRPDAAAAARERGQLAELSFVD